jgi:outer membrane protein assembly factor BamB
MVRNPRTQPCNERLGVRHLRHRRGAGGRLLRQGGIHCYDLDGKPLWSRDLGGFPGPWGTSASPIIVGDLVIQNCDAQREAFLLALDRKTGKDVWKTPRTAPERGGWSTPVLVRVGDREELVLNGEKAVTGYDPRSGKELWSCKSFAGRGEPTVAPGRGLVHVVNGLQGDIYAVKPGGSGDVTGTHLAWHTPRGRTRSAISDPRW